MLTRDYKALNRSLHTCPTPASSSQASSSQARESSLTSPFLTAPAPNLPIPSFNSSFDASLLLSALVEALPKGLLVLSADRAIVYWNQTARRLCQKLASTQRYATLLPTGVSELCQQLEEAGTAYEPILLEYETPDGCSFRLSVDWLTGVMDNEVNLAFNQQAYIFVTIEDRDEVLQQDIQLERKKFHLTNREAEVWLLLRREYSYQAIANALHISLNTVKTHIRNIHAKRHPYQSLPA